MDYKQNKDFQTIESIITSLERQLKDVDQIQLQDFEEMKQRVEEHFQKCINALIGRKNTLIQQLSDISRDQVTRILKMKEDVSVCLEGYKGIQYVGIQAFNNRPNRAEQIWRGALALEIPTGTDHSQFYIDIDLPDLLVHTINAHGTVKPPVVLPNLQNITVNIPTQDIQNVMDEKDISVIDLTTKLESYTNSSLISSNSSLTATSRDSHIQPIYATAVAQSLFSKFSEVDMVTTFAGSTKGFKNGTSKDAQFNSPRGICFNPNDNCFYVGDYENYAIRRMTLQGYVSTFAKVKKPIVDVVVYHKENTIFACSGNSIIKILPTGIVCVLAGDFDKTGYNDGVGPNARFYWPVGIAIDQKTGTIFVCDANNNVIRVVTQKGEVSTLAGSSEGYKDANGMNAQFNFPFGICFNETDHSLLVCDFENDQIRHVSLNTGEVSTVCEARQSRRIIAVNGKFLVSSKDNFIFQLTIEAGKSELKKIAGSGKAATVDGRANECSFNWPACMAAHEPSNSCYVTEYSGHVIRKITFK